MSPQTNGTDVLNGTERSDVRMRMRFAANASEGLDPRNPGPGLARTRAIAQDDSMRQGRKIHNFLSPHVEDAKTGVKTSWAFTERPESVLDRAHAVIPAKGEVSHWVLWLPAVAVGVACLGVSFVARLVDLAFATRRRGAASLAAIALAVLAHKIAQSLT